ncbi:pantoate--beta-alanine ligase [Alteromonas sp. ASW11-19]|uniref:Pantothenate synthetase n=1 Tax=Alteromonas salexigens TaxID=2982530 RepID=A0ABT2VN77_9ALTE|nr:pantoate--beta-alanine ligase [Alteromonas salexigens]MCU7554550.1 pantoate--beta-alanine ligase [Alteromonas salexigens]
MQLYTDIPSLRDCRAQWHRDGLNVGFVPTMGNLHDGHLKLVREAKRYCDKVVVSIFVNPMQFGANEDLDAYPRTLDEDREKLAALEVDGLFLPTVATMYPKGLAEQTFVEVPGISDMVCGASRPGHFRGVATVVTKLFNMVQPDHAFFGEKDYQQLQVIRALAEDLSLPVTIHGVPTERETSGLALSSRNGYLTAEQRTTAPALYKHMRALATELAHGDRNYAGLSEKYTAALNASGFTTDYVEIRNAVNLAPATRDDNELVVLIAAFLGRTRLIDNTRVTVTGSD